MRTTLVLSYDNARPAGLLRALGAAGVPATASSSPHDVRACDVLVLPDGFDDERTLERGVGQGVLDAVAEHLAQKKPLLAVGFGLMFLLAGKTHPRMPAGLSVFDVSAGAFDPRMVDVDERPLKTPHTGFGFVVGLDRHAHFRAVLPDGASGAWFYFRHRLCAPARVPFAEVAVCHHGVPFAGAIWREHVVAVQFLPELSGGIGVALLKAWRDGLG